jgi:peptide/nickel transport system permease protein
MSENRPSAWKKFKSNPLGMAGLAFIGMCVAVALAGPVLRPDASVDANRQLLALAGLTPGSSALVLLPRDTSHIESTWKAWLNGGYELKGSELAISHFHYSPQLLTVVTSEADTLLLDPQLYGYTSWNEHSVENAIDSRFFLLGTDKFGRDVLSRLMAGTSVSLSVGLVAVAISLLLGLTLGLAAGYFRGMADAVIMWLTNVVWAVPTLLLVMAITFAFGNGFWKVFLAVGLTMWVEVARIARGQVLGIREKEFIEAARALGYSDVRIVFKHVLPNILSPVIVISAANFSSAILIEAGLSFLGLGAQIPTPSWGNMIREHYAFITTDLAYLALVPGLLIMLTVLAFMLVGNSLRDALDVRDA